MIRHADSILTDLRRDRTLIEQVISGLEQLSKRSEPVLTTETAPAVVATATDRHKPRARRRFTPAHRKHLSQAMRRRFAKQ